MKVFLRHVDETDGKLIDDIPITDIPDAIEVIQKTDINIYNSGTNENYDCHYDFYRFCDVDDALYCEIVVS